MRASLLTRAGSIAAAAAIATTGALATAGAAGAAPAVKRLPTHLSIAKIPAPHDHVVIVGRLTSFKHPLRNEVVYLDRKAGIFLVQVAHEKTNKSGAVAFIVDPPKTTQYVLVFKGSANFSPSHSTFVTVRR
jgi:Rieske Fe-S protein